MHADPAPTLSREKKELRPDGPKFIVLFISDAPFDPTTSPVVKLFMKARKEKLTEFNYDKGRVQRVLGPKEKVDCLPLLYVGEPEVIHATGKI